MDIISLMCTVLVLGVLGSVLLFILYACTWPIYERYYWRYKDFRSDNLKSIVLVLGKNFTEREINNLTEELSSRVRIRTGNKIKNVRTITTSIGPDGICYVTVWYKPNTSLYAEQSYNYYDMSQFKIS